MSTHETLLTEAIRLRENGDKKASRSLLLKLVQENPTHPEILYQCAWTHDSLGLEQVAVSFYMQAIHHGLSGNDLAGALLGLGSTLRSLGEYQNALEFLEKGIKLFPEKKSIQVFYAMALYNSKRSKEAVSLLLKLLTETTSDSDILDFKRAISNYAEDLDRVWK